MSSRTIFNRFVLLAAVAVTACSPSAQKQTPASNGKPSVLKIVSTEVQRADGRGYAHEIFLDGRRFASLPELQRHLAKSGGGIRIEYDFSCLGLAERPLAQHVELEAFQKFCTNNGIDL